MKLKYQVLRVFVNNDGDYGNPVAVISDLDKKLSKEQRQEIAAKIGFSETVFIHDLNPVLISIFNPKEEVKFAGHAVVGTVWHILNNLKIEVDVVNCLGGEVKTWEEDGLIWIQALSSSLPPWNYEELDNVDAVEDYLRKEASKKEHTVVWSWKDQGKGIVRARTFAPDWGIPEDEANGSGSMGLSVRLKSRITVIHGNGSIIHANSNESGLTMVGGKVKDDGEKESELV
jgi:predicted PhzF superfamily epimerase YddE/YHI9